MTCYRSLLDVSGSSFDGNWAFGGGAGFFADPASSLPTLSVDTTFTGGSAAYGPVSSPAPTPAPAQPVSLHRQPEALALSETCLFCLFAEQKWATPAASLLWVLRPGVSQSSNVAFKPPVEVVLQDSLQQNVTSYDATTARSVLCLLSCPVAHSPAVCLPASPRSRCDASSACIIRACLCSCLQSGGRRAASEHQAAGSRARPRGKQTLQSRRSQLLLPPRTHRHGEQRDRESERLSESTSWTACCSQCWSAGPLTRASLLSGDVCLGSGLYQCQHDAHGAHSAL